MRLDVRVEGRAVEFGHAEHERHRLDQPVLLAADGVRRARVRGDIAVAGRVDDGARADQNRPRLRLEDDAFDDTLADHFARERVKEVSHPRLVEQIERDALQNFRVERATVLYLVSPLLPEYKLLF